MDLDEARKLINSSKEDEKEAYKLLVSVLLNKVKNNKLSEDSIFRKKGFETFEISEFANWEIDEQDDRERGIVDITFYREDGSTVGSRHYEFYIFCSGFGGATEKDTIISEDGEFFQIPDSPADLIKENDDVS